MRRLFLLFVAATLTTGISYGQTSGGHILQRHMKKARKPTTTPTARPPVSSVVLNQAADEIFAARPEVTGETLTSDAEVIEASLPAIQIAFSKRGFSHEDAQNAALSGWKWLRIKRLRPAAVLSESEFMHCVTGMGPLSIKTTPSGALIWIDGQPQYLSNGRPDKTNALRWTPSGPHHVQLKLEGYQDDEVDCRLEDDGEGSIERILKPIARKNPD